MPGQLCCKALLQELDGGALMCRVAVAAELQPLKLTILNAERRGKGVEN